MPNCTIEVRSATVDAAIEQGKKLPLVVQVQILPWLDDRMLAIQATAQKLAPVKEGHLRGGATSKTALVTGVGLVGTVEFGGLAEAYAAYQHFTVGLNHPKGGQDHFLFGRSDSAWERHQKFFQVNLERKLQGLAEQHFAAAKSIAPWWARGK